MKEGSLGSLCLFCTCRFVECHGYMVQERSIQAEQKIMADFAA